MALIHLNDVSVLFPVHTDLTRSLRHSVLAPKVGAFFHSVKAQKLVCVEALSGLNLELNPGDRLGLLGHNGSGKSTLLKVLAGVYAPTSGSAVIEGRRLSMFDLGQGIQTDGSGIENIIALGMLHGRSRKEINAAMDSIIEFSELGDYINMPVRTYSAGMLVRLAFAVVTGWPADILLIDEVIGAGDAGFFEKAYGRITDMVNQSSIVVLASHSHDHLRNFCNKGLVMNRGRMHFMGDINQAIDSYHTLMHLQQA